MRVRITRQPEPITIDGIPLSQFKFGLVYALPASLATLLVVEGWAVPIVDSIDVAMPEIRFQIVHPVERRRRTLSNRRLSTELGIAADRRRPK